MWQYFEKVDEQHPDGGSRHCYIHDGTQGPPSCDGAGTGVNESYGESRAAVPPSIGDRTGVTWKETTFDDSEWDGVDLPHDFVRLGAYSADADGHHGYLPRDTAGWYRKSFSLPAEWTGTHAWLHLEGVFQAVDVFLNGKFILRHTSGYLPFDVPLAAARLGAGSTNVLALRVDSSFGSGHWYEGGGVQRRVWLHHVPSAARFVDDGLFALTANSTISGKKGEDALVVPTAEVLATATAESVQVTFTIYDPATHAALATATTPSLSLAAGTTTTLELQVGTSMRIERPELWSVRTPTQYLLASVLSVAGAAADSKNVSVGIRNFIWRDEKSGGATLNGEPLRIRGFSHHSDFGGVGGAVPDRINLFRASALRSVGGNTWRTSHNPCACEFEPFSPRPIQSARMSCSNCRSPCGVRHPRRGGRPRVEREPRLQPAERQRHGAARAPRPQPPLRDRVERVQRGGVLGGGRRESHGEDDDGGDEAVGHDPPILC